MFFHSRLTGACPVTTDSIFGDGLKCENNNNNSSTYVRGVSSFFLLEDNSPDAVRFFCFTHPVEDVYISRLPFGVYLFGFACFVPGSDCSHAVPSFDACSLRRTPLLQGDVSKQGAVGVFGYDSGGDGAGASTVTVCAYTEEGVIHRVALRRPAAAPGGKVQKKMLGLSG